MINFSLPASHSDSVKEKQARILSVRPPTPTPRREILGDELTLRSDEDEDDIIDMDVEFGPMDLDREFVNMLASKNPSQFHRIRLLMAESLVDVIENAQGGWLRLTGYRRTRHRRVQKRRSTM